MCHRGHNEWFMDIVIGHVGAIGFGKMKRCSYILGTTGVESSNFRAIQCGDIPIGGSLPKGMVQVGTL